MRSAVLYIAGGLLVGLLLVNMKFCSGMRTMKDKQLIDQVENVEGVVDLFAIPAAAIPQKTDDYLKEAQNQLDQIIAIPDDQRTFANTANALDRVVGLSNAAIAEHIYEGLELLSPDEAVRNAAHSAVIRLRDFWVDQIMNNKKLYQAFKAYVEGNAKDESLNAEQRYFLAETMKDFKRAGLNLPDEKLKQVKKLQKELTVLGLAFSRNIAQDNRTIAVPRAVLAGLEDDFIDNLKQTDDGLYILGVDYPTYFNVMEHCAVEDTRRQLHREFNNRAYPVNEDVLKQIITKRDELARLLGFSSYAQLDIDSQMAKTPERSRQFIADLIDKSQDKVKEEIERLTATLPASVELTADGKIKPWDFAYLKAMYKKEQFDLDERIIAEYFPMEKTIDELLDIYRQFLGVDFQEVPATGLWHDDVKVIKVLSKDQGKLLGILLLDLYPRPNKYSHAAHLTVVPAVYESGKYIPDVSIVMANFPKSTPTKPSILTRHDVSTFFHEFGHALHALLGRTMLASFAGTNTKTDFVELPSQMLEEWLWDKAILKKISGHYKTGEPLPDEMIDKILKLKRLTSGSFVRQQGYLSLLALDYYKEGAQKDPYQIMKRLHEQLIKNILFEPANHFYASFGHLTDYGAKYYGYLWSKVFALDLFDEIKKHGLLNPVIGQKYVREVIGKGGSQDPNELLRNFLGREPSNSAFLKDMGLLKS
ncbi:MAG TPA: hypothetical protein ENI08_00335 [Candidatus Dependentiae bacterium]|nr:hypothetical protein [Candidatus Dependentiae bacterium]